MRILFFALAAMSVPTIAFATPDIGDSRTISIQSVRYVDRNVIITTCNGSPYDNSSFSFDITVDGRRDSFFLTQRTIVAGTCGDISMEGGLSSWSTQGGLLAGTYDLAVSLRGSDMDTTPVHAQITLDAPISPSADSQFSDFDQTYPNATAIYYLRGRNIVSGYADNSFRPTVTINRAEFAKIVVGTVYRSDEIQDCPLHGDFDMLFSDMRRTDWFVPYVCTAHTHGVIGGYPDGTLRPGNPINFAEAAKILAMAFDLPIVQTDVWYEGYVRALADANAIPLTVSSLSENITRGEMAEMVYRLWARNTAQPSRMYEDLAK